MCSRGFPAGETAGSDSRRLFFFPFFLPLLFHLLLFFSHFFFPPSLFSHSFIPLSFLSSLSYTPPIPLLYSRLPLLTPVPTPFSSLTLSSPSLFVFSQLHPSHTPLYSRLPLLTPVPTPFSSLTLSSPSLFSSLSYTPPIPLYSRLPLLTPVPTPFSSLTLSSLSLVFSQLSLPSPPRHSSILPSGLVSFSAPTAPSPEKMFRTCHTFCPKCHRSRKNPPDQYHFPPQLHLVPRKCSGPVAVFVQNATGPEIIPRTSIISHPNCAKSRRNVTDLSHFLSKMPQVPK